MDSRRCSQDPDAGLRAAEQGPHLHPQHVQRHCGEVDDDNDGDGHDDVEVPRAHRAPHQGQARGRPQVELRGLHGGRQDSRQGLHRPRPREVILFWPLMD